MAAVQIRQSEGRFDQLMTGAYRKVYNMAFRLVGNRNDAEDLTQETFYRAYRSFEDYEGDRPFENWVFRILTRLFLDLLRSRRRRVQTVSYDAPIQAGDDTVLFDSADPTPTAERAMLDVTLSEDMQAVLDALTPDQRLLVALADLEGMPYKEIAEIIGKPVGTVRSRLHRTHKQMRRIVEERKNRACCQNSPRSGICACSG